MPPAAIADASAPDPRIDRLIWLSIAAIGAFVLLAAAVTSFAVLWSSIVGPLAAVALIGGIGWVYRVLRPAPRLSAACRGTAQMVLFTIVGAPLSYLAASANLPLQDAALAALDQRLGIDWRAALALADHWAAIHPAFAIGYMSLMPQTALVLIVLGLSGRFLPLQRFLIAFMAAALLTIAISVVLPAEGAWIFHQVRPEDHPNILPVTRDLHLAHFNGLRDGSFRLLVGEGGQGIITFPSLHAATAVIFIAAWWTVPWLRIPGLVLNLLMIAATPIDGGHYFIDVPAGCVIALVALAVARRVTAPRRAPAPQALTPDAIPAR